MIRRPVLVIMLALAFVPDLLARSRDSRYVETYLQYVPAAMHLGLGYAGVKSCNNGWGRAFECGYAYLSDALIVNLAMKNLVEEERPDGSAFNSFPSGHTATAFTGAELVRLEYGWGWGAGAYAIAAGTGAMRVYHQRHWWWDAAAGAGIGILSANIGRWLLKPTASIFPVVDPAAGLYCATFTMTF